MGIDKDFRDQLEVARRRLPPLQIGKQGQLQEWIGDWDIEAPERSHRHLSHLYAMMPGQSITPRETPKFASGKIRSGFASDATIELLPALPSDWPNGKVTGLRARGGFEVDCSWFHGRLTGVTIRSMQGGTCRVCYRDRIITLETKAGKSYRLNGELKS